MKIYTSEQMKKIEASANENGMSYLEMMENAGAACVRALCKNAVTGDKKIAVICGKGKNGGDGFVAARLLHEKGFSTSVVLACGSPVATDALAMFGKLQDVPVFLFEQEQAKEEIATADIIIDAVFGFGFKGEPDENTAAVFNAVNSSNAFVAAIDIPSGAECNSAKVCENCIKANLTLAISCKKPVHVLKPSCEYCGKVITVGIGLDTSVVNEEFFTLSKKPQKLLPKRESISHKGDYGKVLSICGSIKYPGAAVLAATGAVKTGAGLVYAAFPEKAYPAIASKLTEPIMLALPCCEDGFFARAAIEPLIEQAKTADCTLIGCGLGQTLATASLLEEIITACDSNIVIDADGINLLSSNINMLEAVRGRAVITPHPGEMARLLGLTAKQVNENRLPLAAALARKYGIIVILKGENTVVSDGNRVYVNRTGNPGMARGGSGDLLAGMVSGLLAQGFAAFEAAVAAVHIHGKAGDVAAGAKSVYGMTPSDMAALLPGLLSQYEQ